MSVQIGGGGREGLSRVMMIAGGLLLAREAVFYAAFGVLAASIDWPGSLGLAAADALPLIREQQRSVFTGYYLYLLSSIMFLPIAMALREVLRHATGTQHTVARLVMDIAVGFAVVSVVLRSLGILRWLFAMPALAEVYVDPATTQATREQVVLQFDLLNHYAGQAGEHLGVHLLMALFMLCTGAALLGVREVPRAFAVWAVICGLLFVPVADLLGVEGGVMLFVNGFGYSFWAIGLGAVLIWRALRGDRAITGMQ